MAAAACHDGGELEQHATAWRIRARPVPCRCRRQVQRAWVAQSVEQRTRNAQVRSSNLLSGSSSEAFLACHSRRISLSQQLSQQLPANAPGEGPFWRDHARQPSQATRSGHRRLGAPRLPRARLPGRVRHKSRTFRGSKRAAEKELARLVLAQDFEPEVPSEPETADVEPDHHRQRRHRGLEAERLGGPEPGHRTPLRERLEGAHREDHRQASASRP